MKTNLRSKRLPSTSRRSTPKPVRRESPQSSIKSILVPIDLSAASDKALTYANQLAKLFRAKLTVVHVIEPLGMPDFAKSLPLIMETDKMIAAAKERLQKFIEDNGFAVKQIERVLIRYGRAFDEIAGAAESLHADLIVISTHGYTGLKHALLGSTTERVVRHARCPVLVVKSREHDLIPSSAGQSKSL